MKLEIFPNKSKDFLLLKESLEFLNEKRALLESSNVAISKATKEGFELGYKNGFKEGEAQGVFQALERLAGVEKLFKTYLQNTHSKIAETIIAISSEVIAEELKSNQKSICSRVKKALNTLNSPKKIKLTLNKSDLDLAVQTFAKSKKPIDITFEEDSSLEGGDAIIQIAEGEVRINTSAHLKSFCKLLEKTNSKFQASIAKDLSVFLRSNFEQP